MTEPDPIAKVIDQWTLSYMTNSAYIDAVAPKRTQFNKQEHKFYRKRMLGLIKDQLCRHKYPTEELQRAYEDFANTLMMYFKTVDKHDIVQEARGAHDTATATATATTPSPVSAAFNMVSVTADHLTKQVPAVRNTLDDFVIRRRAPEPPSTTKIIPLQLEINLQAEELKTKGVRPKKKPKAKAKSQNSSVQYIDPVDANATGSL